MKAQSGMVLLMSLLVNVVVQLLLLTSMKLLIVNTKTLESYRAQSELRYMQQHLASQVREKVRRGHQFPCVQAARSHQYYQNDFHKNRNIWCTDKQNSLKQYYLLEKFSLDCGTQRYRLTIRSDSVKSRASTQVVFIINNRHQPCSCKVCFAIKEGVSSYRWSE